MPANYMLSFSPHKDQNGITGEPMLTLIYIAAGGAAGALLRYTISGYTYKFLNGFLPWGTLAVNLLGCFAIGLLWNVFENIAYSPNTRALIFIGILGAFTTFSTFGLESFNLFREGEIKFAILNILVSNLGGIAFVFIGYFLSKYLFMLLK
jgi:CrcB protein